MDCAFWKSICEYPHMNSVECQAEVFTAPGAIEVNAKL